MKQFFKEYFSFSKKERNGIIVLITIILLLIIVLKITPYLYTEEAYDFSEFKNEIKEIEDQIVFVNDSDLTEIGKYDFEPFYFDPNTISNEDWKRMGLSDKVISTINNYRNKGGKFYSAEDVVKIYGFPNELFLKVKNYISIKSLRNKNYIGNYSKGYKESKKDTLVSYKEKEYNDTIIIDLNLSAKNEMLKIRDLPYNIVDRILKYRELLGGYYMKEQLLEVYGMDNEIYKKIVDRVTVSTGNIQKILINDVEFKELLKHPYLEYENVRMIMNYRKDYPINSMKDLIRNNLISEEQANKLETYIQFIAE